MASAKRVSPLQPLGEVAHSIRRRCRAIPSRSSGHHAAGGAIVSGNRSGRMVRSRNGEDEVTLRTGRVHRSHHEGKTLAEADDCITSWARRKGAFAHPTDPSLRGTNGRASAARWTGSAMKQSSSFL